MSKVLIIFVLFSLMLSACVPAGYQAVNTSEINWLPVTETGEFLKADKPYAFQFPADHGAHPEYQTEWWYFTGNLEDEAGRQFGYQLTFFRRGLQAGTSESSATFETKNIYMAHFAVTDVAQQNFQAEQRFARDGAQLAGADVNPYARIWLEDWQAEQTGGDDWKLNARGSEYEISLKLEDIKGIVLQGKDGLSAKGPSNASYYYSMTRMQTEGEISSKGEVYKVTGQSWMDHEFSTSALAPDQIGWDWFSIQMDNGEEIMLFTLRKLDGTIDPFSGGVLVDNSGKTAEIKRQDFSLEVTNTWRSPHSQAEYPSAWRLSIPEMDIQLSITPVLEDQELNLAVVYWEGAVNVSGEIKGNTVRGRGYVELTGYAQNMQGQF